MPRKLTLQEIIDRANKIHNNKYDYSQLDETKGILENQIIICPIHGKFKQSLNNHINNKNGCKQCGSILSNESKILPIKQFIKRANTLHKNKYDYGKVKYNNLHDIITIICPIHGEFEQIACNHIHINQPRGCKYCYDDKKLLTKEEFINQSNKIHNSKYNYSLVNWKTTKHKVKIICPIHGIFEQLPAHHLYFKYGCDKCRNINHRTEQKEIVKRFIKIHGNKYDYSKVIYEGRYKKLLIICPNHGEFLQTADSHLNGNGCRFCHESKGERKVRLWMINKNIKYECQKEFDTCLGYRKRKLPFDFYIPSKNILIEYDGKLHYEVWSKSENSRKRLERIKQTDKIKTKWCLQNNIKLIRIHYKQFDNVEKILDSMI